MTRPRTSGSGTDRVRLTLINSSKSLLKFSHQHTHIEIEMGTRNRSLTASLSFPERDPLDRLLVPLIYVTSNKCPAASLYPSKYPTPNVSPPPNTKGSERKRVHTIQPRPFRLLKTLWHRKS